LFNIRLLPTALKLVAASFCRALNGSVQPPHAIPISSI
jgi:hypothetical protein